MAAKVLVTGASGFIGGSLVQNLCSSGVEVLALCRQHTLATNIEGLRTCYINLTDKEGLEKELCAFQPDAIVHLAAIASPAHGDIEELYSVNVHGTECLLDAIKKCCHQGTRVVLASTAGVYGNVLREEVVEEETFAPLNHYSMSKVAMELLSKWYSDSLDIKIVRPFNIIGAGQKEAFLIPKLVKAFATRQSVLKVGNLNTERDYVDVSLASGVFAKVAMTGMLEERVFNLCSGVGTTGQQILDHLRELTGFEPKIEVDRAFLRKNEVMRIVGNPSRMNALLGNTSSKTSIRTILASMLEYYNKQH